MPVAEAREFFDGIYMITDKLKVLEEVGLGYLELGQSATTLSGGEAQRIAGARIGGTAWQKSLVYFRRTDCWPALSGYRNAFESFEQIGGKGNSVIVIEHNMHVIKCADYIVDLGPEGGEKGGKLVASGTPEDVAKEPKITNGKISEKIFEIIG